MDTKTQQNGFLLPISIIGPIDIARILRELQGLDEFFRQTRIRSGESLAEPPRYSRLLDSIVVQNGMNLMQEDERMRLTVSLTELSKAAPVMHISFSTDPPGPYVQRIVEWLRSEIHPHVLVRVGLQPNIGAGCIVRTTNKSFDFSLRKFFDGKREFFAEKLHAAVTPGVAEMPDDVQMSQPTLSGVGANQPAQVASVNEEGQS